MGGAAVGAVVGGKKGARKGAKIGAVTGGVTRGVQRGVTYDVIYRDADYAAMHWDPETGHLAAERAEYLGINDVLQRTHA